MSEEGTFENETDRIDREAAEWLIRSSAGLSIEEERAYDRWLSEDKRHREWTEIHAETRVGFGQLRESIPDKGGIPDPDFFAPLSSSPSSGSKWVAFASVAVLVACVAFAFLILRPVEVAPTKGEFPRSYVTAEFERHFLEDGSLIELKAGSDIVVNFDADEREIRLLRGEVHFSIAKDPERPFVVHAGQAVFRAIGTAFNVRLLSNEVELLVTEGVVRVDRSTVDEQLTESPISFPAAEDLAVNQRATILFAEGDSLPEIETVSRDVVDRELVWKHETLDFESTPLSEAILLFNQRNRDQIEIADQSLGQELIDGTFRSDNLDGFITLLEISADIEVQQSHGNRITFRRKKY